ncbi:MAG TPA: hypothetical protein VH396_18590 [Chitinophagaceae bacterium]|jgi:hypothetical protein
MSTVKFYLSAIFAFLATAIYAQSADDIINKHLNAVGGKELLTKITSLYMEVSSQVMGNEMKGTVTVLNGKGYKSESDFNGQAIIQCITDTAGWMVNPMAGITQPTAMPGDAYKTGKFQIDIEPMLNYAAKGYKAELLGTDTAGSVNAYKIKLTTPDSLAFTFFIDPSTYYTVKTTFSGEVMGQSVDIISNYSDYKKTDFGFIFPYTVDTNFNGQFSYTTTITKVEINKPVDPSIFAMPKQ